MSTGTAIFAWLCVVVAFILGYFGGCALAVIFPKTTNRFIHWVSNRWDRATK